MKEFTDKRFIEFVSQHAVLVTLGVTAISTYVNALMFEKWGLKYENFATASDVITGALAVLGSCGFGVVLIQPAIWISELTISFVEKYRKILLVLVALMIILWLLLAEFFQTPRSAGGYVITSGEYLANYVVFFFVAIATSAIFKKNSTRMLLMLLCFLAILQIRYYSQSLASNVVVQLSKSNCVGPEYLVWAGSMNVVTSCSRPPFDRDKVYFVGERAGAKFRKVNNLEKVGNAQTR